MDALVDEPEVIECNTIVGALELEVAIERRLVDELVDEELDLIKNTNVVFLVLNLEVAISRCLINHVDHVLLIDELGELLI